MPRVFRWARDGPSKHPARAADPARSAGRDDWAALSFGFFSLGKQRKETRATARKLLLLRSSHRQQPKTTAELRSALRTTRLELRPNAGQGQKGKSEREKSRSLGFASGRQRGRSGSNRERQPWKIRIGSGTITWKTRLGPGLLGQLNSTATSAPTPLTPPTSPASSSPTSSAPCPASAATDNR
jgi:hypothetical protein